MRIHVRPRAQFDHMKIMSISSKPSKKRKLDYLWIEILSKLDLQDLSVRDAASEILNKLCTPSEFLGYTTEHKQGICELASIVGWDVEITEVIEAMEGLPSPSNMTFDHVKSILVSETIPLDETMVQDMPKDLAKDEEENLHKMWKLANTLVAQKTEADVFFRLSVIVSNLFQSIPASKLEHLKLNCQPTIENHTDILLEIHNGNKSLLIEMKYMEHVHRI